MNVGAWGAAVSRGFRCLWFGERSVIHFLGL